MEIIRAKIKQDRLERAKTLVPAVLRLCQQHDVTVVENDHGFQFRKAEYVIVWSPRTNKVLIQYRIKGHGKAGPCRSKASARAEPKIVQALTSLLEIV
jgi:hypothetical protein